MAKQVEQLLKKEVTRKEFLTLSGFGLASLFGFGTIVKMVTGHGGTTKSFKHQVSGYGGSVYGGAKES
jgi:hypothetical protein